MHLARNNILSQNFTMSKQANKLRPDRPYKIEDLVILSTKNISLEEGSGTRKLHPKLCDPFPILQFITDVTFQLDLTPAMKAKRIHDSFQVGLLKSYIEDSSKRNPRSLPPLKFPDGHEEYEVDKIINDRHRYGKKQYLVKQKNCQAMRAQGRPRQT